MRPVFVDLDLSQQKQAALTYPEWLRYNVFIQYRNNPLNHGIESDVIVLWVRGEACPE